MNTDFLGGVNENDIRVLGVEILKSSERISAIFDSIDAKINELPSYYKSSSFDEFYSSYESFRKNYEIIKTNIISYSDDLFRLVDKMKEGLDEVSTMFKDFTEERKSKAKEVEYKEVL